MQTMESTCLQLSYSLEVINDRTMLHGRHLIILYCVVLGLKQNVKKQMFIKLPCEKEEK